MSVPTLTPQQNTSPIILPATGSASDVAALVPYAQWTTEPEFLNGAADQVAYTYRHLGGSVVDIELTAGEIYTSYQDACFAYSRIVNLWQAKNALGHMLGNNTGSFDHEGELTGSSASLENAALKYPKFTIEPARRIAIALADEVDGSKYGSTVYSASIDVVSGQQEYDVQAAISAMPEFSGSVGNKKVRIRRVYYRSAAATWRFYGYFGGLNVVGNLSTYGQYADDSTFEVIPTWQNKLQAMAFEDNLWTRTSHYSYKVDNNKLKVWPVPGSFLHARKIWIHFVIPTDSYESDGEDGVDGVNSINTMPFANLPYTKINAAGKDWIRRYSLAISKGMLSHTRGKLREIPIPGESITLNYDQLQQESEREKERLEEELNKMLEETSYTKVAQDLKERADAATETMKHTPAFIWRTGGGGLRG